MVGHCIQPPQHSYVNSVLTVFKDRGSCREKKTTNKVIAYAMIFFIKLPLLLAATVLDVTIWVLHTIAIYKAWSRGIHHIINLISIIVYPLFALIMILAGQKLEVSSRPGRPINTKIFLRIMNDRNCEAFIYYYWFERKNLTALLKSAIHEQQVIEFSQCLIGWAEKAKLGSQAKVARILVECRQTFSDKDFEIAIHTGFSSAAAKMLEIDSSRSEPILSAQYKEELIRYSMSNHDIDSDIKGLRPHRAQILALLLKEPNINRKSLAVQEALAMAVVKGELDSVQIFVDAGCELDLGSGLKNLEDIIKLKSEPRRFHNLRYSIEKLIEELSAENTKIYENKGIYLETMQKDCYKYRFKHFYKDLRDPFELSDDHSFHKLTKIKKVITKIREVEKKSKTELKQILLSTSPIANPLIDIIGEYAQPFHFNTHTRSHTVKLR